MTGEAHYDWADPFQLEDNLTEDKRMIRDSAQAYAREIRSARAVDAFHRQTTDLDIFGETGALGLLGTTLPEEYDGARIAR